MKPKSAKVPKPDSPGEAALSLHLNIAGIPFEREFRFAPPRKFRADFHLKGHKILVEIEGGVWQKSRHTTPKGYMNDMEKYTLAAKLGYVALRYTTDQAKQGKAIRDIADYLIQKHGIKVKVP